LVSHSSIVQISTPCGSTIDNPHARAATNSADVVAEMIARNNGAVLIQEIVNWGWDQLIDCLPLFSRRETYPLSEPIQLNNPVFMAKPGSSTTSRVTTAPCGATQTAPGPLAAIA
jgi:hypothetical protein